MKYLRVHNWDRWQSYRKDRGQPPWIKLHRCLMRHHEWVALNDAERGQLISLWLLAADSEGALPDDPVLLQRLCYMSSEPDVARFVELGFLDHDAKPTPSRRQHDANMTPSRRQHDAPEAEAETELEREPPPTPPATGGALVPADGAVSLEQRIMSAFMDRSADKGLTWPATEREHVVRLAERARADPDPDAWCKRFLETAWRLKREGKGIWKDRPWMPRTFCGPKAITWVIEAMGDCEPAESEQELRDFAATLVDRRRRRGEM